MLKIGLVPDQSRWRFERGSLLNSEIVAFWQDTSSPQTLPCGLSLGSRLCWYEAALAVHAKTVVNVSAQPLIPAKFNFEVKFRGGGRGERGVFLAWHSPSWLNVARNIAGTWLSAALARSSASSILSWHSSRSASNPSTLSRRSFSSWAHACCGDVAVRSLPSLSLATWSCMDITRVLEGVLPMLSVHLWCLGEVHRGFCIIAMLCLLLSNRN